MRELHEYTKRCADVNCRFRIDAGFSSSATFQLVMATRPPLLISHCLLNPSGTTRLESPVHCTIVRPQEASTTTRKPSTPRRMSRLADRNGQRHTDQGNRVTSTESRWAMSGTSITRLITTTKISLPRSFRATSSTFFTPISSTQLKRQLSASSARTDASGVNRLRLLELKTRASSALSLDLRTKTLLSVSSTKSGTTAQSVSAASEAALTRYVTNLFVLRCQFAGDVMVHVQWRGVCHLYCLTLATIF